MTYSYRINEHPKVPIAMMTIFNIFEPPGIKFSFKGIPDSFLVEFIKQGITTILPSQKAVGFVLSKVYTLVPVGNNLNRRT